MDEKMEEKKKGKGFAITAVVLGIIGILASIILAGEVFGVIGAVFGTIAIIKSKGKNKMSIVGTILCVIAIIIFIGEIIIMNTVDVTPPTIKLKENTYTFYIGDTIKAEDLVTVSDEDARGNITTENIKVELGEIDTATEGTKKVKVTATDKANNKNEVEVIVNIVNPQITIYDYIKANIKKASYYVYSIESYGSNHFYVKYSTKKGKDYGIIDFTEMSIKDYSDVSSFEFIDIMKFNSNMEITEIHRTSSFLGRVSNEYLDLNSDTAKSTIAVNNTHFKDILGKLQSSNINITGKTAEQLQNETIDIRELK